MLIRQSKAGVQYTISEEEIEAELNEWVSAPPAYAYTRVPIHPYFATLVFWAWIAYPKNERKRKNAIEALYANGAYLAWREGRYRRED